MVINILLSVLISPLSYSWGGGNTPDPLLCGAKIDDGKASQMETLLVPPKELRGVFDWRGRSIFAVCAPGVDTNGVSRRAELERIMMAKAKEGARKFYNRMKGVESEAQCEVKSFVGYLAQWEEAALGAWTPQDPGAKVWMEYYGARTSADEALEAYWVCHKSSGKVLLFALVDFEKAKLELSCRDKGEKTAGQLHREYCTKAEACLKTLSAEEQAALRPKKNTLCRAEDLNRMVGLVPASIAVPATKEFPKGKTVPPRANGSEPGNFSWPKSKPPVGAQ